MTPDNRLISERFPRASRYNPEWVLANASGGAGKLAHLAEVLLAGRADAVLAASIFHFGEYKVADVKRFLKEKGIEVRL